MPNGLGEGGGVLCILRQGDTDKSCKDFAINKHQRTGMFRYSTHKLIIQEFLNLSDRKENKTKTINLITNIAFSKQTHTHTHKKKKNQANHVLVTSTNR